MTCNRCVNYIIHAFHKDFPDRFEKYYCRHYLERGDAKICRWFKERILDENEE